MPIRPKASSPPMTPAKISSSGRSAPRWISTGRKKLSIVTTTADQTSKKGLTDRAGAAHLGEFLPSGVQHDPAIPTPKSVLGYEVGEWHVRHDQLVQYMYALAEASARVEILETGRTYEQRPLLLLTISSPENLARIEELPRPEPAPAPWWRRRWTVAITPLGGLALAAGLAGLLFSAQLVGRRAAAPGAPTHPDTP